MVYNRRRKKVATVWLPVRRYSLVVELQLPKLAVPVRFRLSAPENDKHTLVVFTMSAWRTSYHGVVEQKTLYHALGKASE